MITVDVNPSDLIERLKGIVANQTETICILEAEVEKLREMNEMLAPMMSVPEAPSPVLSGE